jgi:hypothetical protein
MGQNSLNILLHTNKMYNHIILSSCLFGSFYLFSISLTLTNRALLEDKKIPNEVFIINGLTMFVSGSIVVYNFSLLNSCKF